MHFPAAYSPELNPVQLPKSDIKWLVAQANPAELAAAARVEDRQMGCQSGRWTVAVIALLG